MDESIEVRRLPKQLDMYITHHLDHITHGLSGILFRNFALRPS